MTFYSTPLRDHTRHRFQWEGYVFIPRQDREVNFKDFKIRKINDNRIEEILKSWGQWEEPAGSGVSE